MNFQFQRLTTRFRLFTRKWFTLTRLLEVLKIWTRRRITTIILTLILYYSTDKFQIRPVKDLSLNRSLEMTIKRIVLIFFFKHFEGFINFLPFLMKRHYPVVDISWHCAKLASNWTSKNWRHCSDFGNWYWTYVNCTNLPTGNLSAYCHSDSQWGKFLPSM